MRRFDWLTSRPIAHRGLHDADSGIVENSRSSVAAAIEAGYAIEVDLQLSADNRVMVFHDASLERLTEADGLLEKFTSSELQKTRFRDTSDPMLTLVDLLALVDGQTPLFLEVKSRWKDVGQLELSIAKALKNYTGPVAVMSFDPNSVSEFRRLAPDIPRGIVAEEFRGKKYWGFLTWGQKINLRHMLHWLRTRPDFVAFNVENLISIAPQAARILLRKPLLTWTVRTETDVKRASVFADNIIFENFKP